MQFIDSCLLTVKAGDGGNGTIAWHREAHVDLGGPAGGDGGDGGSIYFLADHNETTLFNLRNCKTIKAENGVNGQSENKTGAKGQDKIVKVPVGTMIYDEDNNLIVDLNQDQQLVLIAKGGKAGRGNASFKTSWNKEPNLYELGDYGECKKLRLELKYLADIGLVGLPNAGKSSFIKNVCNVDVKVANYPFTTIHPVLGTYYINHQKIIFCDIPGLIEGAAEGKGLGHEFLKHVERCSILIHLVSASSIDNSDIVQAYEVINRELQAYNINLKNKKIIVAATKADLENTGEQYQKLRAHLKDQDVFFISTLTNKNMPQFLDYIKKEFIHLKQDETVLVNQNETKTLLNLNHHEITLQNLKFTKENNYNNLNDDQLKIYEDENGLRHISHPIIAYWSHKIPQDTKDNIYRFNQKMNALKLNEVLKKHHLQKDDVIYLDNEHIEWIID